LFFRGDQQVCRIDEHGDLVCRSAGTTEWRLLEPGPFVTLAMYNEGSDRHGCGVHPDGSVRCWQMAVRDPTAPLCSEIVPPCLNQGRPPPGRYVALTAGPRVSCGLTDEGTIQCWGVDNQYGIASPPAGNDFVAIDGSGVQCGLRKSGEVSCWGGSISGLGRMPLMEPATQFEVTTRATCAILADGRARCEGDNDLVLPSKLRYARLNLNGGVCGLTADGTIACAGTPWLKRITPSRGPYLEVVNSDSDVCALRGDGIVECWGEHWGNGGGVETCKLTEARLTFEGSERLFQVEVFPWGESYVGDTPGWSFAESFAPVGAAAPGVPGFGWIAGNGSGRPPWVDTSYVFLEDKPVELTRSVWALKADPTSPGEVVCTAEGAGSTVRRHVDELLFDLRQLTSLGSCPGKPVVGELSLSELSVRGTLDGVALSSNLWVRAGNDVLFTDRSHLQLTPKREARTELAWGILITSPNSPMGAQVICIGSGTFEQDWNLRDLSSLGTCPGGGTGTLTGCVR
jgi:hypothetical protein